MKASSGELAAKIIDQFPELHLDDKVKSGVEYWKDPIIEFKMEVKKGELK